MVARGSKAENIHTASVDTGSALLDELKKASDRGPIKNFVVYGHSWVDNLIMKWDEGFFHSWKGPGGARNLDDSKALTDRGEVRFAPDAVAIFASCGCAGASTFDTDKFAAKFTLATGVTSIAAIGLTEPKQVGTSDAQQKSIGFRLGEGREGRRRRQRLQASIHRSPEQHRPDQLCQEGRRGSATAAAAGAATAAAAAAIGARRAGCSALRSKPFGAEGAAGCSCMETTLVVAG